jgi:hypothetical protein
LLLFVQLLMVLIVRLLMLLLVMRLLLMMLLCALHVGHTANLVFWLCVP